MKNTETNLRGLFIVLSIMAILSSSVGGYLYYSTLIEFSIEQAHKETAQQLNKLGNDIDAYLSWSLLSAKSLAGLQELKHSLLSKEVHGLDKTNGTLDHFRDALGVSVCYLMNRSGNTIASSNRDALDSFVGKNYGFRPYFTKSMQGTPAVYMAMGVTSKERGMYCSYPVYDEDKQTPVGVAVIKTPVESIEKGFSRFKHGIVLVIDPNGVVFFSSRPDWLYRVLWQTSPETISQIEKTKQFGTGPWEWTGLQQINKDSAVDKQGNTYRLHQQELINYPDWRLVSLYSHKEIKEGIVAPLWKFVAPSLIVLCVVFGGIVCFLFIKANASILQRKKVEQDLKESEKKHRILFRDSPDAYLIIVDGVFVECNRATEVMLRGERTQIIGKSPDVISPDFQPDGRKSSLAAEEKLKEALQVGSITFEWEHRRLDGSYFFVDVSITSMVLDKRPALFTTWRDITERKNAEDALHLFKESVENSSDAVGMSTPEGKHYYQNKVFDEWFGEIGENPPETLYVDHGVGHEVFRAVMAGGQWTGEVQMYAKDRSILTILLRAYASKDKTGRITALVGAHTDITESKRAEDTLRLRESYLSAIIENQPGLLWLKDTEGRFLSVNTEFAKSCGLNNPEILVGKTDFDIWPKELADRYTGDDAKVLKSGVPWITEEPISAKGQIGWFETFKTPVFDNQGGVIGTTGYAHDITERKKAEYALRESEDKFRLTFDSSPDSININRLADGLYVDINEGFTRVTGYGRDDVLGKTSLELNIWGNPADRQKLTQGLQEKGFYENLEAQFRRKDGTLLHGLMSAKVIYLKDVPHIISITRDITERKIHEKEQLKIEKLESLGVLAGGIAHDFNNILTGIMGNVSFAKVYLDTAHKSYKPLSEAEKATERARELAHQLLTFARGGEPVKKVVSPQNLVNEALTFVLHGSNVKGTVYIPDSIHAIEADEGQINQVFQNIIINATQAMPGGGILSVTGKNEELYEKNTLSLPPGPYICLAFTDQGWGISDENLKKIFDPYFTTKSTGIGLGLSSVHSIVSRHGGHIGVRSAVGNGTTFTIYLPSLGKAFTEYQADVTERVTGEHTGGSILVMDDDEMIRDIASSMLTHLGYRVMVCASGEEAIDLYRNSIESGTPFSLAIMDLTIPGGLGGKDAAEQILAFYPEARLVVSSGYSNDPIMSNYSEYGFSGAIAKPYNIDEFVKVLGSLSDH